MERLTIVYRPAFAAAKFILGGVNLPEAETLPIQFRKSRLCNVLYSVLSHLHLYSPAFFFRYERDFRKALTAAKGKILFWDCCDAREYRTLFSALAKESSPSIFFWNPVSRWYPSESVAKKNIKRLKAHFQLYSFDKKDADVYGFKWLPSVNRRLPLKKSDAVKWDFYFIGKDKGRGEFLKKLERRLKEWGFRTHFLIVEKKSDAVPMEESLRQANDSACIVDIVASGQEGMTLRPLDALFLGKKLLTNNADVAKMDFYHPSNVYILRDLPWEGLKEFMRTPFHEMEDSLISPYEINHWLRAHFTGFKSPSDA